MIRRAPAVGLLVALAGGAALILAARTDLRDALGAYLVAYGFVLSVALGSLALVLIAHVSESSWFVALRRVAEVVALAVAPLALLFVPVLLGARRLYPWAMPREAIDP